MNLARFSCSPATLPLATCTRVQKHSHRTPAPLGVFAWTSVPLDRTRMPPCGPGRPVAGAHEYVYPPRPCSRLQLRCRVSLLGQTFVCPSRDRETETRVSTSRGFLAKQHPSISCASMQDNQPLALPFIAPLSANPNSMTPASCLSTPSQRPFSHTPPLGNPKNSKSLYPDTVSQTSPRGPDTSNRAHPMATPHGHSLKRRPEMATAAVPCPTLPQCPH